MKKYDTPWSVGSMVICTKCGQAFDKPKHADDLKSELKSHLKSLDAHKKIRVMTSGCLDICNKQEQAVAYKPNNGETEVFTTSKNFKEAYSDLQEFLEKKLN